MHKTRISNVNATECRNSPCFTIQLEMWVNAVMAALPNIGGTLCSTPQLG